MRRSGASCFKTDSDDVAKGGGGGGEEKLFPSRHAAPTGVGRYKGSGALFIWGAIWGGKLINYHVYTSQG